MNDQDQMTAIQYALVEPPDGGNDWPSGLWTRDEVVSALNQRQAKLLKNTLLVVTSGSLPVVGGDHRLALPSDLLRIVSVLWLGVDGLIRELPRVDSFEADHAIPTWDAVPTTAPLVYMEYDAGTLTIQIAPAPLVAGTLAVLYVPHGTTLTGDGVALTVPDELAHAVKYGALADLLSKDGRGKDTARAEYAEQRFDLAVDLTHILLNGWS